jgi:hypothetical protein
MQGSNTLLYRKVYIMSKVKQIQQLIERYGLQSMIQSGMPGYVITIYTKEYRQLYCGNSSESLAYLRGYADAQYQVNKEMGII